MEGVGKFTFGFLSVFVLMNFADGAITGWTLDGTTATPASITKTLAESDTTIAAVLAATDATTVTHSIGTQTAAGQFEIAASTGVITLASGQTLDAETATSLVIEVVAVDDAGTPTTATATITLTITDVNEFDPVFVASSAKLVVPDQLAASTLVYTVAATDSDQSGNTVTYALAASGNTGTDFNLGASNGQVTVANALLASRTSSYTLVVTATDAGSPARSATSTVMVYVGQEPACDSGANGGAAISLFAIAGALIVSLYMLL